MALEKPWGNLSGIEGRSQTDIDRDYLLIQALQIHIPEETCKSILQRAVARSPKNWRIPSYLWHYLLAHYGPLFGRIMALKAILALRFFPPSDKFLAEEVLLVKGALVKWWINNLIEAVRASPSKEQILNAMLLPNSFTRMAPSLSEALGEWAFTEDEQLMLFEHFSEAVRTALSRNPKGIRLPENVVITIEENVTIARKIGNQ